MRANGTSPDEGIDQRPAGGRGPLGLAVDRIKKGLRFDPDLEARFFDDYYEKSLLTVRLALVLGIVLYSLFGILDFLITPASLKYIWLIRFAIVDPYLAAVFVLTFFKFFKKIMQPALSSVALVAGLGIVVMIAITAGSEGSLFYYAGLMLVMMWTYTFVKLRFVYASIVCWVITAGYEITVIFFQGLYGNPEFVKVFVNNNFFFISSNVIGMFACYLIELYTRKEFLQRLTIAEKQKELERNIGIMNDELEMARSIQQKLIPVEMPDSKIYSLYMPMEAVGGDLFDFISFRDSNNIGIFLSDVSGHGVPAALITSMVKSSILESRNLHHDPAAMLMHLNEIISIQTEDNFITAFYCVFDPVSRLLRFSNAGHHPPAVVYNDRVVWLKGARSMPLAILSGEDMAAYGSQYRNSKTVLPAGSKLVLYTDGLVEAKGGEYNRIPFRKGIEVRLTKYQALPCKEFIDSLFADLVEFRGGTTFDDDICIICVDVQ